MTEKQYVAYLTSGLGNRLRPLVSAIAYCELTGRRLRVYWDQITPNGCLAPLVHLYKNHFDLISLDELGGLTESDIGLFTEKGRGHGVQREDTRFGRSQLLALSKVHKPKGAQDLTLDNRNNIVIVYDNDYLKTLPLETSVRALRSLRPVDKVVKAVSQLVSENNLTLQTKSVHARGTDFNVKDPIKYYIGAIENKINVKAGERFFLSTEDRIIQEGIISRFGDLVITRPGRVFLERNTGKDSWGEPDSYTISPDHGLDGLIDIYALSQTTITVSQQTSSFAEVSRHLHGVPLRQTTLDSSV
jgi:hypothetical protein